MSRSVTILVGVGIGAVLTVVANIIWFRSVFEPADYIAAAQVWSERGSPTNVKMLTDACGQVEWRHSKAEDGKHIVEATGSLKDGGKPVVVRWEVTIIRDGNARVSLAQPVFASIGGEELQPASAYPGKLAIPAGK
jgi:hypothetical protein